MARVVVIGTSCAGKTTFARSLATALTLPHIELDTFFWRPNWVPRPTEEFRALTAQALSQDRWITVGNYGEVRNLIWSQATTVIWLNYEFRIVLWRALTRTVRRVVTRERLFSGNRETFRMAFFSRESILWWIITTFNPGKNSTASCFVATSSLISLMLRSKNHPRLSGSLQSLEHLHKYTMGLSHQSAEARRRRAKFGNALNAHLNPVPAREKLSRRSTWLTILALIFPTCVQLAAQLPVCAADSRIWEASINPQTKERYIPVELWAGAEWDGKRELKMVAVNGTYHHRSSAYQIRGPIEWKHPVSGETTTVYERVNPGRSKDEDKVQLFTINQDGTGLGRLFDGRPGRDTRTYSGGLKFPLGLWKENETKSFSYKVWDTTESQRAETITIKQMNFSYQGTPYCLEIYWTATDRSGRKTYDRHTYIYCPGKSMVSQIQH